MIPDDTKLGFGGGTNGTDASDATIEYDENGTDELKFAGADVRFDYSKVIVDGQLVVQEVMLLLESSELIIISLHQTAGAGTKYSLTHIQMD